MGVKGRTATLGFRMIQVVLLESKPASLDWIDDGEICAILRSSMVMATVKTVK
jgi:hypothetical protein